MAPLSKSFIGKQPPRLTVLVACTTLLCFLALYPFKRKASFTENAAYGPIHLANPTYSYDNKPGNFPAEKTNVLSYSLYGDDPRYTVGALANSELYKDTFPGWSMRVYHDNSVPRDILEGLISNGVELIDMSDSDLNPMTWRFLAASDSSIARMCSRDLDSRLSFREFHAVDEWAHSKFTAHVIRDHPSHMEIRCKMPGGMWCAQRSVLKDMKRMIDSYSKNTGYDMDQQFLAKIVWPKIRSVVLQHVSFGCDEHINSRPLLPRAGLEHIGAVYVNGNMRTSDTDILRDAITEGSECTRASTH